MRREPSIPAAPAGYATVNPFIITQDADGLIGFLKRVFGASACATGWRLARRRRACGRPPPRWWRSTRPIPLACSSRPERA
jgi:hypothetical protein